jgi:hypothetical protein
LAIEVIHVHHVKAWLRLQELVRQGRLATSARTVERDDRCPSAPDLFEQAGDRGDMIIHHRDLGTAMNQP